MSKERLSYYRESVPEQLKNLSRMIQISCVVLFGDDYRLRRLGHVLRMSNDLIPQCCLPPFKD